MKSAKSLLSKKKIDAQYVIESSSILLVNDHPAWLVAARAILDSHDFTINSADSLDAALKVAREQPPDLIVSDLAISGMSCAEICSSLKAEPCTAGAPILLITSPSGDDQSLIEGMEAGADDCLHINAPGVLIRKKAARLIALFKEKRARETLCGAAEHGLVEAELRRSERRFRLLLENSSEVISVLEADGVVRYQSPSIRQILGYEPEEMIGKSAFEFIHPDDLQKATEALSLVRDRQGCASAIEVRCLHKDGSERVLESAANNLLGDPVVAGIVFNSRDVTERKSTEEALEETRERNRIFAETATDSIISIDQESTIMFANPAAEKTFGYAAKEMIGQNLTMLMPERMRHVYEERMRRYLESGRKQISWKAAEFVARHGGGREFPVEVSLGELVRDGKHIFTAIIRDITDRKGDEEALRLTQFSIDRNADAVYWIGKDGRLLYVNDAACRMVGYRREEMLCMHLCDIDVIFIAENWPETWETTKRRETFTFESRQQNKRGRIFPVEVAASHLEFNGKEYICAFVRDITERKLMERALRQSEREYRNLFENATDAIVVFEPESGVILEANSRACEMYGLTKEELLGISLKAIEKDAAAGEARVREILTHGSTKNFEAVHFRKDGTPIDILGNGSLVEYAGRTAIVSAFRDVTEIKRLEQQLVQSEKLAALGQLVSGVAHELNNPLTSVIGYTQLALAGPSLDRQVRARLDIVSREAERTRRIVQNLLSFSRQHKPSRTAVDINDLLERTLELRTYELRMSNITVNRELSPVPMALADGHQLQQVFLNVVVNAEQAIKSCERKGTLTVRSKVKQVDGTDWVNVEIADDGPGIQPETIHKIFDPFFTTKPLGKGTGLGLSISYGIMKEHGGAIKAESRPGGGATFVIELPA
jgi:PAS domain S-box-containing protein